MDALEVKAQKWYEAQKANKRARYKLARELGFSSQEASIVCGWGVKKIQQLAEERLSKQS